MKNCPYCKSEIDCDWVDVGVGFVQCGPYFCEKCGASEIGPEWSNIQDELDVDEKRTGFYKNKISPYANTVGGNLVDHKTAKRMYEFGLLDDNKTTPQVINKEDIPF